MNTIFKRIGILILRDRIGELLEDSIISIVVSLGQVATGNILSEPEGICFRGKSLSCQNNIPKTFTTG